jgi:hypothetical protein
MPLPAPVIPVDDDLLSATPLPSARSPDLPFYVLKSKFPNAIPPPPFGPLGWASGLYGNCISSQLDRTDLTVQIGDAKILLSELIEEIADLSEECGNFEDFIACGAFRLGIASALPFFIDNNPPVPRPLCASDVATELTDSEVSASFIEVGENSDFLARAERQRQEMLYLESYYPELQAKAAELQEQNDRAASVISGLVRELKIIRPAESPETASRRTRQFLAFDGVRGEKQAVVDRCQKQIEAHDRALVNMKQQITDLEFTHEALRTQVSRLQKTARVDVRKTAHLLERLRQQEMANKEKLRLVKLEDEAYTQRMDRMHSLFSPGSMENVQESVDGSRKRLNGVKNMFDRWMKRESANHRQPLSHGPELSALEDQITELKMRYMSLDRKAGVTRNKGARLGRTLAGFGFRVPPCANSGGK